MECRKVRTLYGSLSLGLLISGRDCTISSSFLQVRFRPPFPPTEERSLISLRMSRQRAKKGKRNFPPYGHPSSSFPCPVFEGGKYAPDTFSLEGERERIGWSDRGNASLAVEALPP